ncbi:MAG: hypothetical protein AAF705_04500 [Bacteroidota bacterium]
MKKSFLAVCSLIILVTACSTGENAGPKGDLDNNVFTDEIFGLQLGIPETWQVNQSDAYDEQTILRLKRDELTDFEIKIQPLLPAQHFEDFMSERLRLVKSRSSLFSAFGIKSVRNVKKIITEINGTPFHLLVFNYKRKDAEEEMVQAQFYRQTGRDVISFITNGRANEGKDPIGDSIDAIDFSLLPPADDSQVKIDRDYYQEGIKSTDKDGYFSLYEYDMIFLLPEEYTIRRNLYADGWSTRLEKDEDNHIVITQRVIDPDNTYNDQIRSTIKGLNESFGKQLVNLKSRVIDAKEYDYFSLRKIDISRSSLEAYKEEFISEFGTEAYEKEYEKTSQIPKGAGVMLFTRPVSDYGFLNMELTYTSRDNQEEFLKIVDGIDSF